MGPDIDDHCEVCRTELCEHTEKKLQDLQKAEAKVEELEAENKKLRDLRIRKGIDDDCIYHTGLAEIEEIET